MSYNFRPPGSPNAAILQNMLGAQNPLREPESENEALLKEIYDEGQGAQQEAARRALKGKLTAEEAQALADKLRITDTASGAIASFPDGADSVEIKSATVEIVPKQDLHGYENPWPAGGGANRWDEQWTPGIYNSTTGEAESSTSNIRSVNPIPIGAGVELYIYDGDAGGGSLKVCFYDSNDTFLSYQLARNQKVTTPANTAFVKFSTTNYGTTYKNNLAVNYPATVTTYSPYSNICPISGWTGCEIDRTDGNNIDKDANETGSIDESGTEQGPATFNRTDYIPVTGHAVVIYGTCPSGYVIRLHGYNASKTWAQQIGSINTLYEGTDLLKAFAVPNGIAYVRLSYPKVALDTLELWQGTTIPISWQSEAGTVYGGTLTYEGDGVWTVESNLAYALLNDPDKWRTGAGTVDFRYEQEFAGRKRYANSYSGLSCSYMIVSTAGQNTKTARWEGASSDIFGLRWTDGTLDTVKADAASGKIAICYELAIPTTYTLTTEQVVTLLGQNNFWADTGDTSVTYRADTKLYINKVVAALA